MANPSPEVPLRAIDIALRNLDPETSAAVRDYTSRIGARLSPDEPMHYLLGELAIVAVSATRTHEDMVTAVARIEANVATAASGLKIGHDFTAANRKLNDDLASRAASIEKITNRSRLEGRAINVAVGVLGVALMGAFGFGGFYFGQRTVTSTSACPTIMQQLFDTKARKLTAAYKYESAQYFALSCPRVTK